MKKSLKNILLIVSVFITVILIFLIFQCNVGKSVSEENETVTDVAEIVVDSADDEPKKEDSEPKIEESVTPEKNIEVPKEIDITAPGEVANFKAVTGDSVIYLSWDEPEDDDFARVIILNNDGENFTVSKGNNSFVVKGLKNGTRYDFVIKTVDFDGNTSKGVTNWQYAMYPLTEKPQFVESVVIKDVAYDMIKFGDYPQSLKKSDVVVSEDTTMVNGLVCYYGLDGYYYYEKTGDPKYFGTKFDNNEEVLKDNDYLFKVEPVIWRVLDKHYVDGSGKDVGYLVWSDKVLRACSYYNCFNSLRNIDGIDNIAGSNYKYSEVRAMLNGYDFINVDNSVNDFYKNNGLLQNLFTEKALKYLKTVNVDNGVSSALFDEKQLKKVMPYFCENTNDKMFLLSFSESVNKYGFGEANAIDESRAKIVTDFGKAARAAVHNGKDKDCPILGTSICWLRTPDFDGEDSVMRMFYNGDLTTPHFAGVGNNCIGIVPAFVLKSGSY